METVPLKIHQSVKEDFKIEQQELEIQVQTLRSFVAEVAKEIGTVQELPAIKARIHTLVSQESKLNDIKDERPLMRHPFEGIGERVRIILDNFNKLVKLSIKNKSEKSK